ncbi:hypothetical protein D3C85_1799530 [compost metagenome]
MFDSCPLSPPRTDIFLLGVEFFQAVACSLEGTGGLKAAFADVLQRAGGFVDGTEQHLKSQIICHR